MVRGFARARAAATADRVEAEAEARPAGLDDSIHTSGCTNISDRPITETPRRMYEFGRGLVRVAGGGACGFCTRASLEARGSRGRVGARAQREDSECLCGPGAGLFQDATLMISDQDRVHARAWLRVRSGNRGRRHRCHTRRGPRCAICAMLPVRRAAASAVLYVLSTGARRCGRFRVAVSRPLWRPAFCRT